MVDTLYEEFRKAKDHMRSVVHDSETWPLKGKVYVDNVEEWRAKDWIEYMEANVAEGLLEQRVINRIMNEVKFRLAPAFAMLGFDLKRFLCTESPEAIRPKGEVFEQVFFIALHRHLCPATTLKYIQLHGDALAIAHETERYHEGLRFD